MPSALDEIIVKDDPRPQPEHGRAAGGQRQHGHAPKNSGLFESRHRVEGRCGRAEHEGRAQRPAPVLAPVAPDQASEQQKQSACRSVNSKLESRKRHAFTLRRAR